MKKKRVTEIIGEMYPFYDKTFKDSLSPAWIKRKKEKWNLVPGWLAEKYWQLDYDIVMDRLCKFWTYVNLWFNDYCKWFELPNSDKTYEPYFAWIKKWISETNAELIDYDFYVETDKYFGSWDAVMRINWENWLIDLKTYDAYKYLFWIKDDILNKKWQPKLSSSNRKKVTLQTSMYRNAYEENEIHRQWVLWITQYGTFLIELEYDLSQYEEWKMWTDLSSDLEYGKRKTRSNG